jgi:predicted DNA-binding mobile mystery protein A
MPALSRLTLRQLDRTTDRIRKLNIAPPRTGWLRTIRDALGMSMPQLGHRLGLPRQAVDALEKREANGTVTLNTLREAAAALDADLVYAIVPRQSLARTIEAQAHRKALAELRRIAHTMHLEDQAVDSKEAARQLKERTSELLQTRPRSLWDTDPRG